MLNFNQLSYWEQTSYLEAIDYLIVGSGIVGLSTAIHLKQSDPSKKVVVLERGYLPSGGSTKNAGFACIGSPSELLADIQPNKQLSKKANNQNVRLSGVEATFEKQWDSVWETVQKRWKGLQYLRQLLGDEAIGYEEKGSYEIFKERERFEDCLDSLDSLNERIEEITTIPNNFQEDHRMLESSGMKGFCGAISIKAEGMIDTGKMMQSLIAKAVSLGVLILNGIEVNEISDHQINGLTDKKSPSFSSHPQTVTIQTTYGRIQAKKLAICTNGLAASLLHTHPLASTVRAVRAQVIVTSPIENLPFSGTFHFDEGYYYFRNVGNRVLFGGGRNQNFEAEETDELNTSDQIINHLSSLLEEQILPNQAFTIDYHWAGTMGVGEAKEPIVEKISEPIFCAVRLGGMGVAIGSILGKELAELMKS